MQQVRKSFVGFAFTSAVDCKPQDRRFARKQVGADYDQFQTLRPCLLRLLSVS